MLGKVLNKKKRVPALFEGNGGLINCLVLCFFPLYLEVSLTDRCRLNVLHIINSDFLSDQVRLLKSSLIVIVDIPIDDAKLTIRESQLGSQHDRLKGTQIN